jgi:putative endonuclease
MNERGEQAEILAADFLRSKGLRIAAKNYRSRYGEIDLIACEGATVVFVEVRSRTSETYGGAAASITTAKRQKLIKTARHYLAGITPLPQCRFDAVLVTGDPPHIEWIRNAIED